MIFSMQSTGLPDLLFKLLVRRLGRMSCRNDVQLAIRNVQFFLDDMERRILSACEDAKDRSKSLEHSCYGRSIKVAGIIHNGDFQSVSRRGKKSEGKVNRI
jgi:hypothetical protein